MSGRSPSGPRPMPPADRVAAYDRLVAGLPGVERKGATMPYTSVSGNMFSYLDGAGSMALRLGATERTAFIAEFSTALHVAHGTVQQEYVTVPPDVLDDTERLLPWLAASHAYALTLRPKPSHRA